MKITARKALLIAFLFCLATRLGAVAYIHTHRASPIEVDDYLSYVMHGKVLEVDPRFESPLLKSFSGLYVEMPQVTPKDFQRNRMFHRVNEFYHPGHAVAVWVGLKLGLDVETVWWILAYLLQVALLVPLIFIAYRWLGLESTLVALGVFQFTFGTVAHQLTAAPREWSAAGFFLSIWYWWRIRDHGGKLWLRFLILSLFLTICLSSHTVGKLLVLQVLGMEVMDQILDRKRRPLFWKLLLPSMAMAWVLAKLPHWAFGVPNFGSTPKEFVWEGAGGKLLHFTQNLFENLALPFIPGVSLAFGILMVGLIALGFWRNRRIQSLVLSAFALQISFYFVSLDYTPIQKWFSFEDYYFTCFYFAAALAIGAGWNEARKSKFALKMGSQKFMAATLLIFCLVMGFQIRKAGGTSLGLAVRGNVFVNPQSLVAALEEEMKKDPSCVVVDNEVSLYTLMTYGNYSYQVAFNQFCEDLPWDYRNEVDGSKCKYVFVSDQCKPLFPTTVLKSAGVQWVGVRAP